ncbi:hypothetical protein LWC35_03190 [Pseudonocardia kujensis]|nr:hypothetical protein [Pseudonocardia kujensis]MCE0761921.1 hypothetical protein [Pseudonocardia kujensis]
MSDPAGGLGEQRVVCLLHKPAVPSEGTDLDRAVHRADPGEAGGSG